MTKPSKSVTIQLIGGPLDGTDLQISRTRLKHKHTLYYLHTHWTYTAQYPYTKTMDTIKLYCKPQHTPQSPCHQVR